MPWPETPTEHVIEKDTAQAMIQKYRDQNPVSEADPGSWTFRNAALGAALAGGGVGIRVYRALTDEGNHTVILTGVDEAFQTLWDGTILEMGIPCPPFC